jgi:DNA mismatch endonuclease (patch repair protein)
MLGNRRRDTRPELAVRRALHRDGMRFRVDYSPLADRRRADIVFTRARVAVFIDGCFWHSCPDHASVPRSNQDYWIPKFRRNVERDRETDADLLTAGWTVLRFWEHEDPSTVAESIRAVLRSVPPPAGHRREGAEASADSAIA